MPAGAAPPGGVPAPHPGRHLRGGEGEKVLLHDGNGELKFSAVRHLVLSLMGRSLMVKAIECSPVVSLMSVDRLD